MSKYLLRIIAVIIGVVLLVYGGNLFYRTFVTGSANELLFELKNIASKDVLSLDRGKVLGSSLDFEVYSGVLTADGSYSLLQITDGKISGGAFEGSVTAKMPDGELIAGTLGTSVPEFTLADGKKSPASIVEPALTVLQLKTGESMVLKITKGTVVSGRLTGIAEARTLDAGNLLYLAVSRHEIKEGFISPTSVYVSPVSRLYAFIVLRETGLKHQSLSNFSESKKVLAASTGDALASVFNFDNNLLFSDPGTGAYHALGGVGSGGVPSNSAVTAQINQLITQGPLATTQNLVSPSLSALLLGPGSVAGSMIQTGSITADKIAAGTITADKLAAGVVTSSTSTTTVSDGAITTAKLADGTVTGAKISDDTITASDLSSILTFASGDLVDLSAITHSSTSKQGLILPNVSTSSPSYPSSGEGYLAYDTSGNQVIFYNGSSWETVGSTLSLTTSGGSSNTSSNSCIRDSRNDRVCTKSICSGYC